MVIVTTKHESQYTFGEVLKNLSINYDGTIFSTKKALSYMFNRDLYTTDV